MKKRVLTLLLAVLCVVLCACGDNSGSSGTQASSGSAAGSSASSAGSGSSAGSSGSGSSDSAGSAGAASAASAEETGAARKTGITVGIAQDLDESLDPHKAVAAGTKEILFNVFEGLMKPTPEGDLIPAVAADEPVISEDGLTYTFTLRENVQFHNGETVTAEDVVYSISRCATEGLVDAFANIEEISSPADGTVVITLKEPDGDFLSYLTTAILPADYTEQDTAPVGTGPFQFVSRTPQESIELKRFDGYWGEPAYLETVTLRIFDNAEVLVQALQSGAIDFCAHLTSTQVAQLGDGYTILEGTMNLVQALYLNNAVEPLNNEMVRQALCYAVDKQQVLDILSDGHGKAIGSSMYPTFAKYFDDSLTDYYTQDTEKAKSLLSEAGYPDGFDLTITVPSNYQPHIDTAEILAEQLRAINVNVTIEQVDWATWLERVYSGRDFQSTVVGVDASNMTARALLERFTSDYAKNFINYSNEEYDALFQQVLSETDDDVRTELYKQMERNLTEHAANVYIQDLADLVACRSDLTGYEFYPIYVQDFSRVQFAS